MKKIFLFFCYSFLSVFALVAILAAIEYHQFTKDFPDLSAWKQQAQVLSIPPNIEKVFLANEEALNVGGVTTADLLASLWLSDHPPYDPARDPIKTVLRQRLLSRIIRFHLTRKEIRSLHITQVHFGLQMIGVNAAAVLYFGKSADKLSLAEAAFLPGLARSPSLYNPIIQYPQAKKQQEILINRMWELGIMTEAEKTMALSEH